MQCVQVNHILMNETYGCKLKRDSEDPEHTVEVDGVIAQPSQCTLALFHPPIDAENAPAGLGYVSNDGHHFSCGNPIIRQKAFHV